MRSALFIAFLTLLICLSQTAEAGSIGGRIGNPDQCKGVQALLRVGEGIKYPSLPKIFHGKFDRASGEFTIDNLPEGRYDLRILVRNGILEGVDMAADVVDNKSQTFPKHHEKALRKTIANLPDAFADITRPLIFEGTDANAKVLVEKIRHRSFHSGKQGETIWRIEIWTFENRTGAWVKTLNRPVICRLRIPKDMRPDKFRNLVWIFSPQIGGIEISSDRPATGLTITIPKPDISRGKVSGSVSKQIEAHEKLKASSE